MWFGEPHPFPERGSPTRLSASGQQGYEGWSCRILCYMHISKLKETPSNITTIYDTGEQIPGDYFVYNGA